MKIFFRVLVIICFFTATQAKAQFKFGIKAGVNLTEKPTIKSANDVSLLIDDIKGNAGWFVGPTAKYVFPIIGLGVEANVIYSQTNIDFEGRDVLNQNIDIPLYLRYELSLPIINNYVIPFIAIGPQFSWNIGDKSITLQSIKDRISDEILNSNNIANIDNPLKEYKIADSNISLNLGLGVILFKHLQIHANYNLSFEKSAEIIENGITPSGIIEIGKNISDLKANTWQISLAYLF